MLSQISWEIFARTISTILGVYYLLCAILFYRSEIKSIFSLSIFKKRETSEQGISGDVMGKAVDAGTMPFLVTQSPEEISYAHETAEPMEDHDALIKSVSSLVAEARLIIKSVRENNMDKAQTLSLLSALFLRYRYLKTTSYKEAVSFFVCEFSRINLNFEVSPEEAIACWDQ